MLGSLGRTIRRSGHGEMRPVRWKRGPGSRERLGAYLGALHAKRRSGMAVRMDLCSAMRCLVPHHFRSASATAATDLRIIPAFPYSSFSTQVSARPEWAMLPCGVLAGVNAVFSVPPRACLHACRSTERRQSHGNDLCGSRFPRGGGRCDRRQTRSPWHGAVGAKPWSCVGGSLRRRARLCAGRGRGSRGIFAANHSGQLWPCTAS